MKNIKQILIDFELWRIQYDVNHKNSDINTKDLIDLYFTDIEVIEKRERSNKVC